MSRSTGATGTGAVVLALVTALGAAGCQDGAGTEMGREMGPDAAPGMDPGMDGGAAPEDPAPSRIAARLEMPASVPVTGGTLPIVVRFTDAETGGALGLTAKLHVAASAQYGGGVNLGDDATLAVWRDVGTVTARLGPASASLGSFSVEIAELAHIAPVEVAIAHAPGWRQVEGTLEGEDLQWGPGSFIEVTGSVEVPEDETLTIGAGARVRIADDANIDVEGDLMVAGTAAAPVVLEPAGTAWGGLRHDGTARYSHVFLVGGGGDESRAFGHSGSQPVIHAEPEAHVVLDHVVIQDAPGKAVGAEDATFEIADSVIARTDTGGELVASAVHIARTHFFDFPDRDAPLVVDDDNDALYLRDTMMRDGEPVTSIVEDSVFVNGLDDGLDHSGATVEIRRSWFEGFTNEGIACSEGGAVHVLDSVITGNAQGLEVGHGAPAVTAAHVLIVDNDVGVRYGDSYEDEYEGTLDITGSIIAFNRTHAVWNHLLTTGAPKDGVVRVRYSLVSGAARDGDLDEGVVAEAPRLGTDHLLLPGSAGMGAAGDGADMGLLTPRPTLVLPVSK